MVGSNRAIACQALPVPFVLANSTDLDSMGSANFKAEKSKLRFHKEAFRTLLCGHLIPDLADIALDYFWVLMFVRIHLALSFCVIFVASVEGLISLHDLFRCFHYTQYVSNCACDIIVNQDQEVME
jgi:hypothetical protein